MKVISFTNGDFLTPIIEDPVSVEPNVTYNSYILNNFFAISRTGIFANATELLGSTFIDNDGNTWSFTGTNTTINLKIVGNENNVNIDLPSLYSGNDLGYYIKYEGFVDNKHKFGIYRMYRILLTQTGSNYINRTYYNGVNDSYAYETDKNSSIAILRLYNRYKDGKFFSMERTIRYNASDSIGIQWYMGRYSSSTRVGDYFYLSDAAYSEPITTYSITYHLVHATGDSENPTSVSVEVAEGQDVFIRFYPEEGYELKYGSVPIGTGYGPDDSVIYVWNAERGEMMIRGFTSDITVEVIGVAKPYPIDPSDPTDPSTIDPDSPNYDFSSTIIPIPSRPTWDYAQAGFCNVYLPTAQELNSLALYLWSGSFSADNFKKMFNNPMEAILGCHLVPLSLDDIDHDDGTLAYGNNDTGIEMKIALSNWISYDCGRVKLPVYYGAYLSYSPYTKIQIYLPFIGMHRLDADSIIGKYVHVVYRIDIVTGSCVALIAVGDDTEDETVMYQFSGSCSTEIPVTQGDYKNALQILQGVVSSSVGMVSNVITSGFRGGYSGMAGAIGGMASGAVAGLGGAASALVDAVKPDVSISGNLSSSTGYLGVRIPYLVISTPRVCLPDEQGRFIGLPIYATSRLQQLTGFTQVESIHLEGFYYTEDELSELEELLKSGVIL